MLGTDDEGVWALLCVLLEMADRTGDTSRLFRAMTGNILDVLEMWVNSAYPNVC